MTGVHIIKVIKDNEEYVFMDIEAIDIFQNRDLHRKLYLLLCLFNSKDKIIIETDIEE